MTTYPYATYAERRAQNIRRAEVETERLASMSFEEKMIAAAEEKHVGSMNIWPLPPVEEQQK